MDDSWVGKITWRRDRLSTPVFLDFPGGSAGKESAHNAGDLGSIRRPGFNPWVGKIPWRREQLPTPVSWPGKFKDCIVHGVTNSQIQLSDFHFHAFNIS